MTSQVGLFSPDSFFVKANDGKFVQAKYLTDSNGNYVLDSRPPYAAQAQFLLINGSYVPQPLSSSPLPYIVAANDNPVDLISRYSQISQAALAAGADASGAIYAYFVAEFKPGGPDDVQRSYITADGQVGTSFVGAFTDAASFRLGLAAQAAGLTRWEPLVGGGAVNFLAWLRGNNKIDLSS